MPRFSDRLAQTTAQMKQLAAHIPETTGAFTALHRAAGAEGALSPKVKEMIALGIAISTHCDGCIAFHVKSAIKKGATKQELAETIGVAIQMGGGPATVYGGDAWSAVEEFSAPA
ncbi:MAG: carboxymuconolactone decarboxylase family protein [Phycisphaeraceae bacterium]|nr:carboxymuconolactone decarboxylase family protein [Phycisphaeraceae bacterium]